MKGYTQAIKSLSARALSALAVTLLLAGPLGCEDEATEETKEAPGDEDAKAGDAEAAAALPTDDELAKEAEETITADNADEQADALAEELEAELGDE